MNSKHCLPIRATSMQELEQRLETEAQYADVVEIWLDSIKDLRLAEIFFELEKIDKPVLFVNKAPCEGGDFMGTPEEQIDWLTEVFERGAEYVDVAIQTDPKLIKQIKKAKGKKGRLILSYHNFKETPSFARLKHLVEEGRKAGADIVKIATYVHDRDQNVELFKVTAWAHEENIPVITIGMGENGRMSRVICPLLGSLLYYAPVVEDTETAPGQLPKADLERIWKLMNA